MKSILMLGAAIAVAAAMASTGRLAGDSVDATQQAPDEAYVLQFAGLDASCTIRRLPTLDGGDARLMVGEGCSDAMGGAVLWHDNGDGSVSFVSANGQPILDFAQGDGAAYETFRPGAPLASLVATD